MNIRALIFDFDGTILDTESVEFAAWQHVYQEYGCELALETWLPCIGTAESFFDPYRHLETQLGRNLSKETRLLLDERRQARHEELLSRLEVLAGVENYLHEGKQLGLKMAVASSSTRQWVARHLDRFGLLRHFDAICTSDDVPRTKPDPALYKLALKTLGVQADEAIAIEDSLHGLTAAKGAGIFTVTVPGPMTRELSFAEADLRVSQLSDLPLADLLENVARLKQGRKT